MRRRTCRELELVGFAEKHRWSELITGHGADPAQVMATVGELQRAFPGRRRVRAHELASLIEHRMPAESDGQRALNRALVATLEADYDCAFVLTDGARLAPGRPVLLLGTPRSGNTLLQRLFHELLGFPVLGAPTIDDIDVSRIDSAVFIQMHAPHNRAADRFVDQLGARVVTIARHPLDVLVSILHFSRHERQILDWLDGAGIPSPATLDGATPTSDQFVEWATGKGAARLLGVTHGWWQRPETRRVRYEDLIADTSAVMSKLVIDLDVGPEFELERRLDGADADGLRRDALLGLANHHRWRGKADGWREFLTRPIAERLHDTHRRVFDDLGYSIDGPMATGAEAAAAWGAHVK